MEEEFLMPMGISAYLKGKRRISADTALRLSKYLGKSSNYWIDLQNDFDIEEEKLNIKKELELIETLN